MAVLIASSLRKEHSGDPLFDGVSFKVERRDRLALAGPNGAGKTTLLRALIGETELAGGELAWEKGARVALHDQRPPRLGGFTLRDYALSGAGDLIEAERELRRLEEAMAGGDHAPETLRRYGEAQARLEHAGGYGWRDHATVRPARARLRRRRPRPRPRDLLRRRADARLARARALGRPRPAPARRADEPPRHGVDGVARAGAADDRRGRDPRRARPLVPRVGRHRRARARGRQVDLLPGQVARLAAGEGRAARDAGQVRRAAGGGHRAARPLRRPLPLRDEVAPGAGEAEADRADRGGARRGAEGRPPDARLRVPEAGAERPDRARQPRGSTSPLARSRCSTTRSSCSSAESTWP